MSASEHWRHEQWVVGVDGSPGSAHALRWAADQARGRPVAIRSVHAWHPTALGIAGLSAPSLHDQVPDAVHRTLDELAAMLGDDAGSVEWSVVLGNPSGALLDVAEGADLLIVGTRGLGGFKRLLLGSVSHQCAMYADVPVAVVPESASVGPPRGRLVVGMDGSANAKAALTWALSHARPASTVVVLGTWEPSSLATAADRPDFDYLAQPARERFTQAVDEMREAFAARDVMLETDFRYAGAAEALLGYCADVDLLVVGARGHGAVASAVLGSVSSRILHHASCPVVIVPAPHT